MLFRILSCRDKPAIERRQMHHKVNIDSLPFSRAETCAATNISETDPGSSGIPHDKIYVTDLEREDFAEGQAQTNHLDCCSSLGGLAQNLVVPLGSFEALSTASQTSVFLDVATRGIYFCPPGHT